MWKNLKRQDIKQNRFVFLLPKEKIMLLIKAIAIVIAINICFYQNPAAFLWLWCIGVFFYQKESCWLLFKKKEAIRGQFRELLLLTVAGQKAGYGVENAFLNGYEDLANLYGADSGICKMLQEIQTGLENHIAIGELWKSIGEECEIVEIKEFAGVLMIAVQSGGKMIAVMERTADTIADKADTKTEIAVVMRAKVMEQKIMNGMPLGIILYMNVTSPGYFGGLYHSVKGTVLMTGCLLFYCVAYVIGEKTAQIDL